MTLGGQGSVPDSWTSHANRPEPGQRLRVGSRLFHIKAVHEADFDGRFLTCLAEEERAA